MRLLQLPGAPALLPRVGGRADPAAALRTACREAVAELLDPSVTRVTVLAAGERTAIWPADRPDPIGRLTGLPTGIDRAPLPLPLAVGRFLLSDQLPVPRPRELILQTVSAGPDDPDITRHPIADGNELIVAIADGSALGRPGGPAAVHPRAAQFDEDLVRAWRSGDPAMLAALDRAVADQVMSTGGPVWHRLAEIAEGDSIYRSKINFADAPFGVFQLIASWR